MDDRMTGQHVRGGSLWVASFSDLERQFLATNLGKKKAATFDGPAQSVDFAMSFAADMGKAELAQCKAAMKVPSVPAGDAGGGGNSPAARTKKTKKKTKKKS